MGCISLCPERTHIALLNDLLLSPPPGCGSNEYRTPRAHVHYLFILCKQIIFRVQPCPAPFACVRRMCVCDACV